MLPAGNGYRNIMGIPVQPDQIAQRIRTILRRDLKLGATAELPDSMPLMGGNMDLDSLDVLLLITNIEKEFGVKIASQEVGRQAFESVGGLIRFVTSKCQGASASPAAAGAVASAGDLLSRLPHQPPFRFITTVGKVAAGDSGEGTWSLTGSEPFFAGHFPGNPLVPGVLIAEALAQLSGLVGAAGGAADQGKLAQVDVRFLKPVAPPAEIALKSKSLRSLGALQQFEVSASYKGETVAEGTVTIAYGASGAGK